MGSPPFLIWPSALIRDREYFSPSVQFVPSPPSAELPNRGEPFSFGGRAFEAFRGFESFSTCIVLQPIRLLRRLSILGKVGPGSMLMSIDIFPAGDSAGFHPLPFQALRASFPEGKPVRLAFISFPACTIVQPPSRRWRQPPELRGACDWSHFRLVPFYNLSACSVGCPSREGGARYRADGFSSSIPGMVVQDLPSLALSGRFAASFPEGKP